MYFQGVVDDDDVGRFDKKSGQRDAGVGDKILITDEMV